MAGRKRIELLLAALDLDQEETVAVLLVLTDDSIPHHHPLGQEGLPLSACGTTAEVFKHATRYLSRFKGDKLDREARDFYIAPLREAGLIEQVQIPSQTRREELGVDVVDGWPVAKNQYSGHRVTSELCDLLAVPEKDWDRALRAFIAGDEQRRRRARQAETAATVPDSDHARLIRTATEIHLEELDGYEILYVDDRDGQRVSADTQERLSALGLEFGGNWRYPDAILADVQGRRVWVVDAVVSDGEIDPNRYQDMLRDFEGAGWEVAGMTTAYTTWKRVSARQGKMKNLAPGTHLWVAEDGGRFFRVDDALEVD
jgi:hypothetical protein